MEQSENINYRQMLVIDEDTASLADWRECYHYLIAANPAWLTGLADIDAIRKRNRQALQFEQPRQDRAA